MTCATAVFDSPHKIRQQAVSRRVQSGTFFDDGEAGEDVEPLCVCPEMGSFGGVVVDQNNPAAGLAALHAVL